MEITLRHYLEEARKSKHAIGHFNISDLAALKAIGRAASELRVPVMIGVSEGEREFVGIKTARMLVNAAQDEFGIPLFLNADHTHSLEKALEAARAGFDEIIFDASKLSLEENSKQTKQAVLEIKSINPNIIIEGEIGYIGSSSEILENTPEGAAISPSSFSTAQEAVQFVRETGVDVLAPAVGNMHGLLTSMVTGEVKKHIDSQRVKQIGDATGVFLTLHGGSGTADADFVSAVEAGITIVHVNTEIRLAWRKGIEQALQENSHEVAPYKLFDPAISGIHDIVVNRLKLFNRA